MTNLIDRPERQCSNCRYWVSMPAQLGDCRFKPPVVTQATAFPNTSWPQTKFDDWCGEYCAPPVVLTDEEIPF